jgi:hypothetical protein
LQNQLRQLDAVETAVVQENDSKELIDIGPFTDVPPSSQVIIIRPRNGVQPSNLGAGEEDQIFETLFEAGPGGIEQWDDDRDDDGNNTIAGSELRTDEREADWQNPKKLAYHTAIEVSVDVSIDVQVDVNASLADFESDFKKAVREYVADSRVGQDLYALQIERIAAEQFDEILNVTLTEFNGTADSFEITEIEIAEPGTVTVQSV